MQKLGITDGRQFLKRRLKQDEGSCVFLQTCCVGQGIQDHLEAVIEEALTTGSWVHTRVSRYITDLFSFSGWQVFKFLAERVELIIKKWNICPNFWT